MHTYSDFGVYLHQGSPCDRGCNGLVCGRFFPGLRKNLKSRTFRSFCPLFERADCTAVKTAKAKEEDRTKIDPLEKSYVSTETGQVQFTVDLRGLLESSKVRWRAAYFGTVAGAVCEPAVDRSPAASGRLGIKGQFVSPATMFAGRS